MSGPLEEIEIGEQKVVNWPLRLLITFLVFSIPLSLLLGHDQLLSYLRRRKSKTDY
jgi:hypothetical protein